MIQPLGRHPGSSINKRLGQYVLLTYLALWYGKLFHMALVDWPVTTATTPGTFRAADASIETMRAWGNGLLKTRP